MDIKISFKPKEKDGKAYLYGYGLDGESECHVSVFKTDDPEKGYYGKAMAQIKEVERQWEFETFIYPKESRNGNKYYAGWVNKEGKFFAINFFAPKEVFNKDGERVQLHGTAFVKFNESNQKE